MKTAIFNRQYNGAASVDTIFKRIQYGGRKGRSALRKLELIAKDSRALLHAKDLRLDMSPGSIFSMANALQQANVQPDANGNYLAFVHPPRAGKTETLRQMLKVAMHEIDG